MANQYGIDMGQVVNSAEAGKDRAYKNRLMEWKGEDRKIEADQRKAAADKQAQRNALAQRFNEGDNTAMRELITLQPEEAGAILDAFGKMDETQRKKTKEQIDFAGRAAFFILEADDKEQAYQTTLQSFPEEMRAQAPDKFDPAWVQWQLARATELDALMENPDVSTFGGQDVMHKGGREIDRTTSNSLLKEEAKAKAKAAGGEGGPKSADESLMYRAIVQSVTGMDISNPDQAAKFGADFSQQARDDMLATAARATEIWKANPNLTRLQAAAQARRDAGGTLQDYSKKGSGADRENLLKKYLTPKQ